MVKCIFCGKEENSFMGVHLIKNDGTVSYFCSSKCRKNALKLGRDKRKLKWTEAHKIARDSAEKKHKLLEAKAEEKKAEKTETKEKKKK